MKLFPPEESIDIYHQGFDSHNILDRRSTSKAISDLVEKIEDPLVIVFDGPWGCGKSHFLKRWVGAHRLENQGKATTVYFDAFANDFLDDPLTGLAGAISERLPKETDPKAQRILKGAVAKLARPALKAGFRAVTAGLSDLASPAVDALISAGGDQLEQSVDEFWKREDGKRAAMKEVETSLLKITSSDTNGNPLVIVVDELDRCRPDYALSVLEVIKHFFAVPHVHFILGVNLSALEHSVRSRYGDKIDAEGYLRRFTSVVMSFPKIRSGSIGKSDARRYWLYQGKRMGLHNYLLDVVDKQVSIGGEPSKASIRDINRILSLAVLMTASRNFGGNTTGYQTLLVSMLLMKALQPRLFQSARDYEASLDDICKFHGVSEKNINTENRSNGIYNHTAALVHGIWEFVLSADNTATDSVFARSFDGFTSHPSDIDLDELAKENFDLFTFTED